MSGNPAPVVVLVRPQLGENIGKTARAMRNFGLRELRLVAPRDGWPNPAAGPAAAGADRILDEARVFDSVAEAIADLKGVLAATVRPRHLAKEVMTPEQAVDWLAATMRRADGGRAGVMFGPERSGLDNDETALADAILTIPVDPGFASLNLAQAVLVLAYEWRKRIIGGAPPPDMRAAPRVPADRADYLGLFEQLERALDARGHFPSPGRRPVQIRALRGLLLNARFTAQEIRTLRGVVKTLTRPVRERRSGKDGGGKGDAQDGGI